MVTESDLKILQWIRQNVPSYVEKKLVEAKKPINDQIEFSKKELSTALENFNSLLNKETNLSEERISQLVDQASQLFKTFQDQTTQERIETKRAISYLLESTMTPGIKGADGKDGKDGVGIKDIKVVEASDKLIFIFVLTDNTERKVEISRPKIIGKLVSGGGGSTRIGSALPHVRVVSTDTIIKSSDDVIVVTGNATITLPGASNKVFRVKRFGENITVTVVSNGGKLIDGDTSRVFNIDLWSEDYKYVKSSDSWVVL